MKIGVIGGGKWGEALHFALSQKNKVYITSRRKRDIKNFTTLKEVLSLNYLIFAIPAQSAREWLSSNFEFKNQNILVASKGIEANSGKFLNEILEEFVPLENLAYISGPSFAKEVMEALPTALVINSKNLQLANTYAKFFPDFIKTYVSDDVIGAEICGAYKNVIAIASGICDGLELGNNARASLISRGLVEMSRFGLFFGAKQETFLGLSGAGDLFLTASSKLSRNYRVGFALAKGEKLDNILSDLGEVAEGVFTAGAIKKLSTLHDIYTPIASEVYKILNSKDPRDSLKDLLSS